MTDTIRKITLLYTNSYLTYGSVIGGSSRKFQPIGVEIVFHVVNK